MRCAFCMTTNGRFVSDASGQIACEDCADAELEAQEKEARLTADRMLKNIGYKMEAD